MEKNITKTENGNTLPKESPEMFEKLIIKGDLSSLTLKEKINYYNGFCHRLGLDPLTQPFKILKLGDKEVLYCDRGGVQQLAALHKVSHQIVSREFLKGSYIVTTKAILPDGRYTENIGSVPIEREGGEWKTAPSGKKYFKGDGKYSELKGDELSNAMMKAETKAKRRATLDLIGLGIREEEEISDSSFEYTETNEAIRAEVEAMDDLNEICELFEMKKANLTQAEINRAKEIIETKEQKSYKKLRETLKSK